MNDYQQIIEKQRHYIEKKDKQLGSSYSSVLEAFMPQERSTSRLDAHELIQICNGFLDGARSVLKHSQSCVNMIGGERSTTGILLFDANQEVITCQEAVVKHLSQWKHSFANNNEFFNRSSANSMKGNPCDVKSWNAEPQSTTPSSAESSSAAISLNKKERKDSSKDIPDSWKKEALRHRETKHDSWFIEHDMDTQRQNPFTVDRSKPPSFQRRFSWASADFGHPIHDKDRGNKDGGEKDDYQGEKKHKDYYKGSDKNHRSLAPAIQGERLSRSRSFASSSYSRNSTERQKQPDFFYFPPSNINAFTTKAQGKRPMLTEISSTRLTLTEFTETRGQSRQVRTELDRRSSPPRPFRTVDPNDPASRPLTPSASRPLTPSSTRRSLTPPVPRSFTPPPPYTDPPPYATDSPAYRAIDSPVPDGPGINTRTLPHVP
ncbi:hypothetical protein MBANPS3_001426 [Mucor bainieri]